MTGRIRRWHPFHVAALLFIIWVSAGQLLFHGGERLPFKYWTYVQLMLVLLIIWELAPSRERVLALMMAYVLGCYVSALDTILVFRREAAVLRRFSAGGGDANDLAMTLALALPMAWYLGMTYHRPIVRWICRGYIPIALFALGLTGSRGGMIVTMIALLIVPLSVTHLSPGKLASAVVLLGLAGVLAVAYIPENIVQRLASTSSEVEGGSLGGRFKLWKAGMHAFAHKPVWGYGASGFKAAITPELGDLAQVAHNSFISVLVEEGMVGLLLYLLMLFAVFRAVLKLPRPERRFALVVFIALCVAMSPLTWEDRKVAWFVLAALLGLSRSYTTAFAGVGRPEYARRVVPGPRPAVVVRAVGLPGGRTDDSDAMA
jgi:O-antigen ligase